MPSPGPLRLAIDIGGTFTDTVLMAADRSILATAKTATTPDIPALGALDGARDVLRTAKAAWRDIGTFIHGTTLATNALIERRGARVATITTAGFRDILEIAYERRYSQYAINIEKPDLIVPRARALTIGGRMNARGEEISPLEESAVPDLVRALQDMQAEAVAICLMHSYANPAHEDWLRALLADQLPGLVISLSHEVSPEAREFDRLCTTIANAYVQPLMARYLADFTARFSDHGLRCPILMMTAGGGMTTIDTAARLPIRLVESGPAGGAILAARIAAETGTRDVLSFDMGGTTAKLCLIDDYRPQTARKFEIARASRFIKGSGMPVRIPVIEMIEIGAGGGSIATRDRLGRVQVGPHSAGADPGPAAFDKGGTHATVTDADILQGYIDPARFAEGRLPVNVHAARQAIETHVGEPGSAATAISEMVDESMASAARMHAVESGKDLGTRVMIAFGGNGPLHATRVARRAQVSQILIPRDPGVGSAVGFLDAPVSFEIIRSYYQTLGDLDVSAISSLFDTMADEAEAVVRAGAPEGGLNQRRVAFMRYHGQGHEIEIDLGTAPLDGTAPRKLAAAFEAEYARQFGRVVPDMVIEILNWGLSTSSQQPPPRVPPTDVSPKTMSSAAARQIWCEVSDTLRDAQVFDRASLNPGDQIIGPALIVEAQTTTYVSADFRAQIDGHGNIWMTRLSDT